MTKTPKLFVATDQDISPVSRSQRMLRDDYGRSWFIVRATSAPEARRLLKTQPNEAVAATWRQASAWCDALALPHPVRVGRRPVRRGGERRRNLIVRISEDELTALELRAAEANDTVSGYVRNILFSPPTPQKS